MNTGEMIAALRKYRAKSRQELADLLGISKQRMGAIEASNDLAHSTIQRVCEVLDFEIMAFPKENRPLKQPADVILTRPD